MTTTVVVRSLVASTTTDQRLAAIDTPIVVIALIGLFLALSTLIFIATGALTGMGKKESEVVRRLSVYTVAGSKPQQISVTEQHPAR